MISIPHSPSVYHLSPKVHPQCPSLLILASSNNLILWHSSSSVLLLVHYYYLALNIIKSEPGLLRKLSSKIMYIYFCLFGAVLSDEQRSLWGVRRTLSGAIMEPRWVVCKAKVLPSIIQHPPKYFF